MFHPMNTILDNLQIMKVILLILLTLDEGIAYIFNFHI
jgi:hypothetical protein